MNKFNFLALLPLVVLTAVDLKDPAGGYDEVITEINISNHPSHDRHPSWSPNGEFIVFESDRNGKWGLFITDTTGSSVQQLVSDEFNNRMPFFHPNGTSILFESDKTGRYELYEYCLISRHISKIIKEDEFTGLQQFGAYSPDGNYLAFCSAEPSKKNYNVFLMHLKSGVIGQLTYDTTRSLYPSWSKDSKEIIFFSRRDGQDDELYRLTVEKGDVTRLTDNPTNDFCPAWISDNEIIFARSIEKDQPELFSLDLHSKKEKRLTRNHETDTEPSVSPDGNFLAWTGYRGGNFEVLIGRALIN